MTLGQVFYGPLADTLGRKKALNTGLALYIMGSLISWGAHSLSMMLLGRFLQGLGVSAPRIISMAIIRDKFHGRDMAYIMSMVMGVFILVPAVAPTVGQAILHVASWRAIFLFYIVASVLAFVWFYFRMEETLAPENRHPFNVRQIARGYREAAGTRLTCGYTLTSGVAFGALLGYLNSSQQIFQGVFLAGENFAIYFGILALSIGAAFFSNSALVKRHGMRKITRLSIYALIAASILFMAHTLIAAPSLIIFMAFMMMTFFCLGLMFGNMNAMAMEPMGHMAGLAAGFIGAGSSLISILLGSVVGQLFNGTLMPLATGFLVLSIASYALMEWTEKGANRLH